jgi:hypothetical protein
LVWSSTRYRITTGPGIVDRVVVVRLVDGVAGFDVLLGATAAVVAGTVAAARAVVDVVVVPAARDRSAGRSAPQATNVRAKAANTSRTAT